jgi:hypothetical protein
MSDEKKVKAPIQIGTSPMFLLFLLFLGLKLTGQIAWSWWWITAPIWGPFAAIFTFISIVFVGALVVTGAGLFIAWLLDK